jgi:hypothetical protein
VSRPFYIVTTARSGSTALARILDTATNGQCLVEPAPNLNVETRLAMDGRLPDLAAPVREILVPRAEAGAREHGIHGEKNLTYGPFIPEMHAQLDCRFIVLKRDGRDVVRSMMDWHDRMFGTIYRECGETGELTSRALAAAANLPLHLDASDFSRPRPHPGDPWFDRWEDLSRFEMCAWSWAHLMDLFQAQVRGLPPDAWIELDFTRPRADDILAAARFVGLEGLDADGVAGMLDARINSLRDRTDEDDRFPRWPDWSDDRRDRFEAIAGPTMRRLGFGQEVPA